MFDNYKLTKGFKYSTITEFLTSKRVSCVFCFIKNLKNRWAFLHSAPGGNVLLIKNIMKVLKLEIFKVSPHKLNAQI